jgi:hypothetical protein
MRVADRKHLGIYLNDHLAGSVVGGSLARRIARQNEGNEYGEEVAEIAAEIEGDKAKLREVMKRLGVRRKRLRLGLAWVVEKGMRLKPNGRLFGYSPLSRVLELEGLTMGITGKLELWRSLQAIADAAGPLSETEIETLIDRAESQRDRVEDLRIKAAREALSGV